LGRGVTALHHRLHLMMKKLLRLDLQVIDNFGFKSIYLQSPEHF
jgi:hypothetical protein